VTIKQLFVILIAVGAITSLFLIQKSWPSKSPNSEQPFGNCKLAKTDGFGFNPTHLNWEIATSSAPWPARDSHALYIFDNKIWLLGGLDATKSTRGKITNYKKANYYNDIWFSTNGIEWVRAKEHADFPPLRSVSVISFKGDLYMLGGWSPVVGYKNGIWKSVNGLDWVKIAESPPYGDREGQKLVIFKDKLWLIGGVKYGALFTRKTFNDIWSSDDGVHWTLEASSTPWHPRWDHDAIVFKSGLWVIGGMNFGGKGYSDVWCSEDGKQWQLVTNTAPFGKRQGHGAVVFKDLMWVVGGLNAATGEGVGDAWYTSNGYDWIKTERDGLWIGREDHGVIVFKDKIWIVGGMDTSFKWHNDVWYLTSNAL